MNAKNILVPTFILTLIALIVTSLLVYTNDMTKDKIDELQVAKEEAAKKEVLSTADSFKAEKMTVDGQEITYYVAENGSGYVFSTQNKGYGGAVVVMTGITADGEISGVKVTSQNETPGLGQKALDASFSDQYKMTIPTDDLVVSKSGKVADNEIDSIAGATITSTSVTNSVNDAVKLYETITGGAN